MFFAFAHHCLVFIIRHVLLFLSCSFKRVNCHIPAVQQRFNPVEFPGFSVYLVFNYLKCILIMIYCNNIFIKMIPGIRNFIRAV